MSTQKYMNRGNASLDAPSRKDPTKTVAKSGAAMGINQSTGTAGRNKTPPPVNPAAPSPDMVREKAWGGTNYGANQYPDKAYADPGETVTAGLKVNAPQDEVLDAIIAGGAHSVDMGPHADVNWQTRAYDPNDNVPVHSAMEKRGADSGSPGGTVPKKTGFTEFNPNNVRKPGS